MSDTFTGPLEKTVFVGSGGAVSKCWRIWVREVAGTAIESLAARLREVVRQRT